MINIKKSKCIFKDCIIARSYNFPNETKKLYCKTHSLNGMIDLNNKNKICIHPKCETRANFNYKNETKAIYCNIHKKENMINIISSICIFKDCKTLSSFNYPNETKPLYCSIHAENGMIDIRHKRCIEENCDKFQRFDKYCARCFYAKFPNDNKCKYVKIKENEVKKFIQENFKELSIIYDEQLKGDGLCFNIRPDIMIHLNTYSIIVECDEYQHKSYEIQCDISRTHKIQEALNRSIIMIRFNPDEYIDLDKKKIKSCFKIDTKIGLTVIPKDQEILWKERLELLKDTIIENLDIKLEEPIKIIKLFYDNLEK